MADEWRADRAAIGGLMKLGLASCAMLIVVIVELAVVIWRTW